MRYLYGAKENCSVFHRWASNILAQFLRGVHDEFVSLDLDTYLFLSYATYGQTESDRVGEL